MHYHITLFVINPLSENMLDPFGLPVRFRLAVNLGPTATATRFLALPVPSVRFYPLSYAMMVTGRNGAPFGLAPDRPPTSTTPTVGGGYVGGPRELISAEAPSPAVTLPSFTPVYHAS